MLTSKSSLIRAFLNTMAAVFLVAYAHMAIPILRAQNVKTCALAKNPCASCDDTGNAYQCLPSSGYSWGSCQPPSERNCNQMKFDCQANPKDCNQPSNPKPGACDSVTPGSNSFDACKYS